MQIKNEHFPLINKETFRRLKYLKYHLSSKLNKKSSNGFRVFFGEICHSNIPCIIRYDKIPNLEFEMERIISTSTYMYSSIYGGYQATGIFNWMDYRIHNVNYRDLMSGGGVLKLVNSIAKGELLKEVYHKEVLTGECIDLQEMLLRELAYCELSISRHQPLLYMDVCVERFLQKLPSFRHKITSKTEYDTYKVMQELIG